MQPALSVGVINTSGDGTIQEGNDIYTSSLTFESSVPSDSPCSFIRVGRGLQPIGYAGFNVSFDPVSI